MIEWILSLIAILGSIMNVKKMKSGFIVWIVADIGWIIVCLENEAYSQIPMWAFYTCLCVWGFIVWRKE